MHNPYALAFSLGAFLYVAAEAAIYVWMPTLLEGYRGPAVWLAAIASPYFFILRVAGRFAGAWMLSGFTGPAFWRCSAARFCYASWRLFSEEREVAVYLLPLSGLFMSVIYPTINSKGISCFPKSEHGAVAGVILFFTCVSAVLGPLAMAAVSDAMGHPKYGFILATGFAALLFLGLFLNWVFDPTREQLNRLEATEY